MRSFFSTIKANVVNLMRYMSVHICNTNVLIADDNIKYIKQYLIILSLTEWFKYQI